MQNSDSCGGDMQNGGSGGRGEGSVIADYGSQAGQWTHTTLLQFAKYNAGYI